MADGEKSERARPEAKGFQGPDLKEGIAGTPECVRIPSSHRQVIPKSAIRKWKLWSVDINNAFLQADGFLIAMYPCMGFGPQDEGVEVEGAGLWPECCAGGLPSISQALFIEFRIAHEVRRPAASGVRL